MPASDLLAGANRPLLEPEIAIRTTRELPQDATIEQVAASVELTATFDSDLGSASVTFI